MERRVPAQEREPVVRDALLPHVEVGQVDVVEDEVVERRAGDGRLADDGLGDVVLPRVQRLLGERRRREAHVQGAALLPRLVDRQRIERGRREDVSGAHVELRAVARADDHAAVELALRERALLVRAGVVERHPARRRAAKADRAALDLDPPQRPRGASAAAPISCQASGLAHSGISPSGSGS